jgi:hypothetical protein
MAQRALFPNDAVADVEPLLPETVKPLLKAAPPFGS